MRGVSSLGEEIALKLIILLFYSKIWVIKKIKTVDAINFATFYCSNVPLTSRIIIATSFDSKGPSSS
jgi:hypothetical protein